MKKIIIELIFDDNEGIIQHSQEEFHDTFKGLDDYVESNVVVSTDVPYDSEKGFIGNESVLTVDFRKVADKTNIAVKTVDALCAQLKHVPGVLGTIFDGEKEKESE